jgi:hypothetical protein
VSVSICVRSRAIRKLTSSLVFFLADEPACEAPVKISIDDDTKFGINEYRGQLYANIIERKKAQRQKAKAAKRKK